MSMTSSAAAVRSSIHRPGTLRTLVTGLKRLSVACVTWRVDQTITLLRTMSGQELSEIGLDLSQVRRRGVMQETRAV